VWAQLAIGFALFLVLEGVFPFLSPGHYRKSMQQILRVPDRALRIFGFGSMLVGVVILYSIN